MRVFWTCSLLLAVGCGKSTPEAESAADESSDETEASGDEASEKPSAEGEERDEGVKETGKLKSTSGGPAPGTQSSNDQQAILQLVIDDPELEPYLKLGEPTRFPLKMSGSSIPQGIELTKSTKPVVFVPAPKDKTDPVLVVTSIEVDGKSATVSFRYDVEGIRGTAFLKKGEQGWELSRSRVVEHYAK
jgi:hypothetical protein